MVGPETPTRSVLISLHVIPYYVDIQVLESLK